MLPEVMRVSRADLYSIFRTRVRNCAEALAVEDGSNRLTYAELHDRVDRLASVFLARGIAPGTGLRFCRTTGQSTWSCNWLRRGSARSLPA